MVFVVKKRFSANSSAHRVDVKELLQLSRVDEQPSILGGWNHLTDGGEYGSIFAHTEVKDTPLKDGRLFWIESNIDVDDGILRSSFPRPVLGDDLQSEGGGELAKGGGNGDNPGPLVHGKLARFVARPDEVGDLPELDRVGIVGSHNDHLVADNCALLQRHVVLAGEEDGGWKKGNEERFSKKVKICSHHCR